MSFEKKIIFKKYIYIQYYKLLEKDNICRELKNFLYKKIDVFIIILANLIILIIFKLFISKVILIIIMKKYF